MTDNPYLRAKRKAEQAKRYQSVRKEQVPQSFLKNIASTYARISETDSQPVRRAENPYTSAQMSPAEIRKRQKAALEERQAEQKRAQLARQEAERHLQLQHEKEQRRIDHFLNSMRQLDPMHPDRRWFDEYVKSCPDERQAALDLIQLEDGEP